MDISKSNRGALAEYRAARAMDMGRGGGDTALLDLKISDLVADSAPAATGAPAAGSPAPAKAPTAQTQAAK